MSHPAIIRLDPRAELFPFDDYPESEIASGSRSCRGIKVHDSQGLTVGIWEAEANETNWLDYPAHEFMLVLEGEVTIIEEQRSTTIRAGQAFVLPKGLRCRWTQAGRVRKVFMIYDLPGKAAAPAGVVVLDEAANLPPSAPPSPEVLLSAPPVQHSLDCFEEGAFSVGLWQTTGYTRKVIDFPRHELMHLISGTVTFTDGAGRTQTFTAGDTFFVPHGTPNGWQSEGTLRKIFCIVMPA
jgi:uncharacterized cupin superfamily protein